MQKPKFESEQEKVVRNINSFPTTFFRCYSQNPLADWLCQPAHANSTSQFSNLSFFTVTKKAVIFITAFSLVTQERFELPTP